MDGLNVGHTQTFFYSSVIGSLAISASKYRFAEEVGLYRNTLREDSDSGLDYAEDRGSKFANTAPWAISIFKALNSGIRGFPVPRQGRAVGKIGVHNTQPSTPY